MATQPHNSQAVRWALLATPWWLLGTWRPLATAGDRWYVPNASAWWMGTFSVDWWRPLGTTGYLLGTWVPGDPGYLATNWVLSGYFYWVPGDPGLNGRRFDTV